MVVVNVGANHFTFTGEQTQIVYDTQIPGPLRPDEYAGPGGQLEYHGPEGDITFRGKEINRQESPLGTLITVTLKPQNDAGSLSFTLLLPEVKAFIGSKSVEFQTLSIKTATHGPLVDIVGPEETYSCFPLLGIAETVATPLW